MTAYELRRQLDHMNPNGHVLMQDSDGRWRAVTGVRFASVSGRDIYAPTTALVDAYVIPDEDVAAAKAMEQDGIR